MDRAVGMNHMTEVNRVAYDNVREDRRAGDPVLRPCPENRDRTERWPRSCDARRAPPPSPAPSDDRDSYQDVMADYVNSDP